MSAPLTPERFAELRRLMEKATPGEWKHWESRESVGVIVGTTFNRVCSEVEQDNGLLIAAMRNNFAALLDEAERAAGAREAAARLILECADERV